MTARSRTSRNVPLKQPVTSQMLPASSALATACDKDRLTRQSPIGSRRLRHNLREKLLQRIIRGDLRPSERIIESRLSAEMKVSRTPLREALLQLEREGFARSDLRRGFVVEPFSARAIRELYPMLWALEGLAVSSSIDELQMLVPDLVRLNSELARARHASKAVDLDARWHEMLISRCKNSRLAAAIGSLRLATRRYELFYMIDTRRISESVAQHGEIVRHIESRDEQQIVLALQKNFRCGMELMLRQMGEEP
jgi:DNA-binding GntR family transcriptional regulator